MNKKQLENEYKSRINKTIDFIENNLEKNFTLEKLANVANFSKFHFNRIFQGVVGETPFRFVMRLRLEKAATMIKTSSIDSITEIAFLCGFTDISIFSRNFKSFFNKTATQYKDEKSNISLVKSNTQQEEEKASMYFCPEFKTLKWRTNMKINKGVEVKKLPEMTVAYIRHIGPYKGDENLFESLWNKLFAWAGPRGLLGGNNFKSLVIYHDDPNVTLEEQLRMSICITVSPDTKVDGEVGKMEISEANYVVARFEVTSSEFQQAWEWVYAQWFPSSGYQPDEKPCFEIYPEEPKDGKFVVDICVPVKPI